MAEHFRHNALFVGGNVREAVNDGRADYTPIFLSEVEALFESGEMPIDVAFIQVSPPDPHGYCSFGVGVDCTLTAAKYAHHVVAQVNAQMPRTYGDSFIHVSELDSIVELSRPLCETEDAAEQRDLSRRSARTWPSLIEDGSVLQCGIGAIPDAILPNLMDRKDLGVHTELISDNVIPLIEAGVINGQRKNFKPRKDHSRLRAGHAGAVRLHRRKPDLRVPSLGLHQRSVPHFAERAHGGHQLGDRGRPDRSGLRRVDWAAVL